MRPDTRTLIKDAVCKVPAITLGYLVGSLIFLGGFVVLVSAQIRARQFYPWLYWATIVATTTLGTTPAEFCDRSLGVGYPGGVSIVAAPLVASLAIWYRVEGTVSIGSVVSARAEWFYWTIILFSQTLGTALGDWVAGDDRGGLGLGYEVGAAIFGGGLVIVGLLWLWPRISRTALFWDAFVLTRPLGATLGELLDKPVAQGGLHISRFYASGVLVAFIAGCILLISQRAARRATSA